VFVSADATYKKYLPSVNVAYDLSEKIKLRAAASKTMTRADPTQLLPGSTFGDPAAQNANIGNPDLKPYTSKNFDLGGEYYTGGAGYIGLALFLKDVDGFTTAQQFTAPFASLGIPFADLSTTQQRALLDRGGPDAAVVTITQQVNLNKLTLKGAELTWVQPLDFLLRGTGFTINGTRITQKSDDNLFATGISPWTYNATAYYEDRGISVHATYVWNDESVSLNPPNNGIAVPIRFDARGQLDLSASYALPFGNDNYKATLDVLNITNEQLRSTFGYDNATWQLFNPGRQVLFGVRAAF
jgi:TonB-dependent receptor